MIKKIHTLYCIHKIWWRQFDISKNGALFCFVIIILFQELLRLTRTAPFRRIDWLVIFLLFDKPLFLFLADFFDGHGLHRLIVFLRTSLWIEKSRRRTFVALFLRVVFAGGILSFLTLFDGKKLSWVRSLCVKLRRKDIFANPLSCDHLFLTASFLHILFVSKVKTRS